ncbi:hypothetical protein DFH09DRAFT_1107212 [Mycena vulgaris]|nr:hypothetical protein DFH09DRAFT_1107212 [Mycena vulgaris]
MKHETTHPSSTTAGDARLWLLVHPNSSVLCGGGCGLWLDVVDAVRGGEQQQYPPSTFRPPGARSCFFASNNCLWVKVSFSLVLGGWTASKEDESEGRMVMSSIKLFLQLECSAIQYALPGRYISLSLWWYFNWGEEMRDIKYVTSVKALNTAYHSTPPPPQPVLPSSQNCRSIKEQCTNVHEYCVIYSALGTAASMRNAMSKALRGGRAVSLNWTVAMKGHPDIFLEEYLEDTGGDVAVDDATDSESGASNEECKGEPVRGGDAQDRKRSGFDAGKECQLWGGAQGSESHLLCIRVHALLPDLDPARPGPPLPLVAPLEQLLRGAKREHAGKYVVLIPQWDMHNARKWGMHGVIEAAVVFCHPGGHHVRWLLGVRLEHHEWGEQPELHKQPELATQSYTEEGKVHSGASGENYERVVLNRFGLGGFNTCISCEAFKVKLPAGGHILKSTTAQAAELEPEMAAQWIMQTALKEIHIRLEKERAARKELTTELNIRHWNMFLQNQLDEECLKVKSLTGLAKLLRADLKKGKTNPIPNRSPAASANPKSTPKTLLPQCALAP